MRLLEHLKKMRDMLSESEHWTQKCTARDQNGNPTSADSKKAHSWCLVGAAYNITSSLKDISNILNALRDSANERYIDHYNDLETTTHSDILNMIDTAIQQTEVTQCL